jgi:hypothetical protein
VPLATLRRETAQIVDLADRDLTRLWRLVEDGAAAEVALRDILPAIVTEYGTIAAAAAAEWYDAERERAEARGRFTAVPLEANDRGAHALIGFALTAATDDTSLRTLILGGTQRRIADHQRLTITSSSVADPAADGWIRVGRGECDWCKQYLDGEVRHVPYDFNAHDNCNCGAVPAF